MDIDENGAIEIIDLCSPNVDIIDEISLTPILIEAAAAASVPTTITKRFPNLDQRLSILPWYPTSDKYDQGHLLLANLPRMLKIK
jgi:hypothetical protein